MRSIGHFIRRHSSLRTNFERALCSLRHKRNSGAGGFVLIDGQGAVSNNLQVAAPAETVYHQRGDVVVTYQLKLQVITHLVGDKDIGRVVVVGQGNGVARLIINST